MTFLMISAGQNLFSQGAQQPTIMVFPSDNLLKRLNCLEEFTQKGATSYQRNYQKAFVDEIDLKFVITGIQERFADKGFPLQDLEYTLKQLQTQRAQDQVENFDLDMKAQLLNTARPDIFLDLDYEFRKFGMYNKLIFTINAIDAYTTKSIGSAQSDGLETSSNDIVKVMDEQIEKNMNNLQSSMMVHFEDLKTNGREIMLRVKVENEAVSDMRRDRCGEKLPLAMWIQNYIKSNSVNGMHKREIVSAKELKFSQIRIPLYDENGYPQGSSDWSYNLAEKLNLECGILAIDFTTSLGEAFIVLSN